MAWAAVFVIVPLMGYGIRHIDNNTLFRYLRMSAAERRDYVFVMRSMLSVIALLLILMLIMTAHPALWQEAGDCMYVLFR